MLYLPEPISDFLSAADIEPVSGGMSAADVYRCRKPGEDAVFYLKTETWRKPVADEHLLYRWLYEGKRLPVPEPLFCLEEEIPVCRAGDIPEAVGSRKDARRGYLLLREARGEIPCTGKYYADPARLAGLAAEGIRLLQQVDASNCPVRVSLDDKLKSAQERLRRGGYRELNPLVPYTKDFKDHAEIFDFLVRNQPEIEPVFIHGDYCLDNFFTDGEHVTAFIDFGNGGVGDGYQDIALCVRELMQDCPEAVPEFYRSLGIREVDEEKLRYYILLDEMF